MRFPIRTALVTLALAGAACEPGGDAPGALDTLERLAFVPPGETSLLARLGPPVVCENREALLVDCYEVTRGEWRAWLARRAQPAAEELLRQVTSWDEETRDWPASFMTRAEAEAYAEQRGMRLPTACEWMRIAAGTRAQPWPWGASDILSAANTLSLRFDRPCPVGTFEQGRTPFGTYDMLGNVWEWVEEPIPTGPEPIRVAWAMGGSFASRQRRLFDWGDDARIEFAQQDLDPAARSSDVGLRCVVEARAWLHAHAIELERTSRARERLLTVGARWGSEAGPWLERLAREPGAPRCIAWLREGSQP